MGFFLYFVLTQLADASWDTFANGINVLCDDLTGIDGSSGITGMDFTDLPQYDMIAYVLLKGDDKHPDWTPCQKPEGRTDVAVVVTDHKGNILLRSNGITEEYAKAYLYEIGMPRE